MNEGKGVDKPKKDWDGDVEGDIGLHVEEEEEEDDDDDDENNDDETGCSWDGGMEGESGVNGVGDEKGLVGVEVETLETMDIFLFLLNIDANGKIKSRKTGRIKDNVI